MKIASRADGLVLDPRVNPRVKPEDEDDDGEVCRRVRPSLPAYRVRPQLDVVRQPPGAGRPGKRPRSTGKAAM